MWMVFRWPQWCWQCSPRWTGRISSIKRERRSRSRQNDAWTRVHSQQPGRIYRKINETIICFRRGKMERLMNSIEREACTIFNQFSRIRRKIYIVYCLRKKKLRNWLMDWISQLMKLRNRNRGSIRTMKFWVTFGQQLKRWSVKIF